MNNSFLKMSRFTKVFIVFFIVLTVDAQNNTDFSSWSIVGLKYELSENVELGLEGQLRLKNNASDVDQYFAELSTEYHLPANFSLGAGLRYIRKNDNQGAIQGYENHFRYNLDLSFKHKIERFSLKYRLRYQNRDELGMTDDLKRQAVRFKGTFDYNIRKWKFDPVLTTEIFNRFKKNDAENGFNRYRLGIGTSYKLKKAGKITAFYRYQKEFDVLNPQTEHIFSLKYVYSLN